jgi:hypothetical protein
VLNSKSITEVLDAVHRLDYNLHGVVIEVVEGDESTGSTLLRK